MRLTRRALLLAAPASAVALPSAFAQGAAPDPRMTERALGRPDAPVAVQEWFSLTCTHCAAFARETFPEVQAKLIDTGKIRYVYHDFPLDRVALTAAMVARALPSERYEAFINTLLASQDRWAFDRSADPVAEIAKRAALAGMPRDVFDKTVADNGLRDAILAEQQEAQKRYNINSTPTFVFKQTPRAGEMSFEQFAAAVAQVG